MNLNLNPLAKPVLTVFLLFLTIQFSDAQIWKKVTDAVGSVKVSGKNVNVNINLKTAPANNNIKYQPIPDIRDRSEVNINKKQKLKLENGNFTGISWDPIALYENQVLPSFIIGWASYQGPKYEDKGSSLGFNINSSFAHVTLKWEIECVEKNFFNVDSGYLECNTPGRVIPFRPKIAWNFKELTKHQTSAPIGIYFRLIDPTTGAKVEKLVTVNLRSINDCLLAYNGENYDYMFASYVNEDDLEPIDKILKEAINTKIINSVVGTQTGDQGLEMIEKGDVKNGKLYVLEGECEIERQIAAVWRVLHDRGIHYSSITNNSGVNTQKLFMQTVRTFDNSIKAQQANCVDGTVVFASILKRMGIRPVLISVPGHCFLGYYKNSVDTAATSLSFLETTMLSWDDQIISKKPITPRETAFLGDIFGTGYVKGLSILNKRYLLQYLEAREHGHGHWKENMNKNPTEVRRADVTELRKLIKPIPVYD